MKPAEPALLHLFFARTAQRWPDAIALEVPPGHDRPDRLRLTYAELARRAHRIAHALLPRRRGEDIVGLFLARDSERLYAGQLGVLEAGAAYACLEPALPDATLREIAADAAPIAILTDRAGRARLAPLVPPGTPLLAVEEILADPQRPETPPPTPADLRPESLAYIIYTSGTTGRPKGVMIEHRSIANLVAADIPEFGLGPGDRVAQNSSASYDSSVEEIWFAFASGATLVVMDDATVRLGPDLVPWLARERLTVLCPPPTLLRTMGCDRPDLALPELKLVYSGGEALTPDVAERWMRGRRLENGYGPTECAVTSTHIRITDPRHLPIGPTIPGLTGWVLNESLDPVPDGTPGELCLGGISLARGYHNRPELTAEKFPVHPRLGRIYRTGDLVHRTPDGVFHYHGRIDAQVKVRGYRIELEAIETRLTECAGVREAACGVQEHSGRAHLVGFIVPTDPGAPPDLAGLREQLARVLPPYMVPAHLGYLAQLPRTVSGKLNRRALPAVEEVAGEPRSAIAPTTEVERRLESVFRQVFQRTAPVSIHDDFFADLGGDSLSAAVATSLLRETPGLEAVTVRDLYEGRTIAAIAARIPPPRQPSVASPALPARPGHSGRAALLQAGWLLKDLLVSSTLAYLLLIHGAPALLNDLGLTLSILLAPLLLAGAAAGQLVLALGLLVLTKRALIGRYVPLRAPCWSSFHVRHWIVQHTARAVPWSLIAGTQLQGAALRLLGARIGKRVHLHRGVDLHQGGWDLLEIGDDATLGRDVSLRLVEFASGEIIVGPVSIGSGATLEVHAAVGAHCRVGANACLRAGAALASGQPIPPGACWNGIPAGPAGHSPEAPALDPHAPALSPHGTDLLLLGSRLALLTAAALPAEAIALVFAWTHGVSSAEANAWLSQPVWNLQLALFVAVSASVTVPAGLLLDALVCRALGRVQPGVIPRWSAAYVRVWLKTSLVDSAAHWLYGTLLWPHWLRLAGMHIGRGCEISSLLDTVPELVSIGDRTFCTDGIYLGGPEVHRGTVTLAPVRIGTNCFLGNGAVVRGGQSLPDGVLLGVCTVADDRMRRPGSAWFGQPPFELPSRPAPAIDPSLTHRPTPLRYATRVFWELMRFALPAAPAVASAAGLAWLQQASLTWSPAAMILLLAPAVGLGLLLLGAALALAVKWLLLGRVRPGAHPLWSCWASRWDFHCMAWSYYMPPLAAALAGTPALNVLLRLAGCTIGREVLIGGDFASDLPDPDMLVFEDGATVECTFQAHTFEDRLLKMDRVIIRRGASVGRATVLLYGAEIGAGTRVAPQSVVMKHERLLPGRSYAGFPTRLQEESVT